MHLIKSCPTCGSTRIRPVRRDVTGRWGEQPFVAKDVDFYECPACGEKVYDQEAMRKIQSSYPRRKAAARRKAS